MTEPVRASTAPGREQTVALESCRIPAAPDADRLLGRPARSLTLEEAMYVCAYLHQEGRIALLGRSRPRFAAGCASLLMPAAGERFTVSLRPVITAPGRAPVYLYYQLGSRRIGAAPARPARGGQPAAPAEAVPGGPPRDLQVRMSATSQNELRLRAIPLLEVDARLVVALYHLVVELTGTAGLQVQAVIHIGIGGQAGARHPKYPPRAPGVPPPTPRVPERMALHDAHLSGRAIDFGGVLEGPSVAAAEPILVSTHWGRQPVPADAPHGRIAGPPARTLPDQWPVYTSGPTDWIDVNWNSERHHRNPGSAQRYLDAERHGRDLFTDTWYRLEPWRVTPSSAPNEKLRKAAVLFHAAFHVLGRHTTNGPAYDDAATEGVIGVGPARAPHAAATPGQFAQGADLLHPDHTSPKLRQTHYDHIHAQIGPLDYEFPDRDAVAADQRDVADHPTGPPVYDPTPAHPNLAPRSTARLRVEPAPTPSPAPPAT